MKLHSITRYIIALIDTFVSTRKHAVRHLRSFRAEFHFQRPSKRWAANHFTRYLGYKAEADTYTALLSEQFTKLIRTITLKPRFSALEVAA